MRRTKALIDVGGQPMATHVAHALTAAGCRDVVIVGGDPTELASLNLPVIADRHPGEGPVGGVLTALHHHHAATHVVVAACDIPGLTPRAVKRMLAAATIATDVVVAMTDQLEPVLAVWNVRTTAPLEAAFDAGTRAMHQALALFDVVTVSVDPSEMRNINRPEDLLRGTLRDDGGGQ
jgi:molybdopterin-guanine dinucleotide biosynthesis protein A